MPNTLSQSNPHGTKGWWLTRPPEPLVDKENIAIRDLYQVRFRPDGNPLGHARHAAQGHRLNSRPEQIPESLVIEQAASSVDHEEQVSVLLKPEDLSVEVQSE
jgi:hypothetical protein